MKLSKSLILVGSLFLVTGCTNQGAELNVNNAKEYLEALKENEGNASFNDTTVTFHISPSSAKGKLFSPDIKGKCNVTVKYLLGITSDFKFDWSEPYNYNDVAFAYKEGGTNESGYKNADSLEGSFVYSVSFTFQAVNVYNLNVTEISGHMLP